MFNRCKHEWETVTEKELPSPWQQLRESGRFSDPFTLAFFNITYIHIMKCVLCGKVDKTIVKTQ